MVNKQIGLIFVVTIVFSLSFISQSMIAEGTDAWSLEEIIDYAGDNLILSLAEDDNYLYMGDWHPNFYVVDKTDWSLEESINISIIDTSPIHALHTDDNYVYLGTTDTYIHIIDKSDWSIIETINISGRSDSIDSDNDYLYTSLLVNGVEIIDKTDWSIIETLDLNLEPDERVRSVRVDDNYLYAGATITDGIGGGLFIIDKTDWSIIETIDVFNVRDIDIVDNYLYVGTEDSNTYIIDKTDWSLEEIVEYGTDTIRAVHVDNDYLYMGSIDDNTYVVDKTDWSLEETIDYADDLITDIVADDNYLYIGSYDTNTYVVNKFVERTPIERGIDAISDFFNNLPKVVYFVSSPTLYITLVVFTLVFSVLVAYLTKKYLFGILSMLFLIFVFTRIDWLPSWMGLISIVILSYIIYTRIGVDK